MAISVVAVFRPAARSPFDFDDIAAIVDNSSILRAWPPSALVTWPDGGTAVSGRPLSNLSFALDYALTRMLFGVDGTIDPVRTPTAVFHATNILLHLIVAGLLGVLVCRTVRRIEGGTDDDRAAWLGLFGAAIWAVHPLNSEAVNYLSQRTEVLVSLWCILAVVCAERSASNRSGAELWWALGSIICAFAGVASKEVAVVIPILVIAYDAAFPLDRQLPLWRLSHRRRLYAGLFSSWLLSAYLILSGARGDTVAVGGPISPVEYLMSQGWAVIRYLQLWFVPSGYVFDYGNAPVSGPAVYLFVALSLGLAAVTLNAWRNASTRWLAFLGTWWFLLLAPSSSFVPIQTEIAAERRAYLASAALAAGLVASVIWARRRSADERHVLSTHAKAVIAAAGAVILLCAMKGNPLGDGTLRIGTSVNALVIGVIALALLAATLVSERRIARAAMVAMVVGVGVLGFHRSTLYADPRVRWRQGIVETPRNPRVYQNLSGAFARIPPSSLSSADSVNQAGRRIDSSFVPLWLQATDIALAEGNFARAETLATRAVRLAPAGPAANEKLGRVLLAGGRPADAAVYLARSAALHPSGEAYSLHGMALLMSHRVDEALPVLQQAVALQPERSDRQRLLGAALVDRGRGREAIPPLRAAMAGGQQDPATAGLLALAYAIADQPDSAARYATEASIDGADQPAVVLAGRAYHQLGRYADAAELFERAVRMNPRDSQALARLAASAEALGFSQNADRFYRAALAIDPTNQLANEGLRRQRSATSKR